MTIEQLREAMKKLTEVPDWDEEEGHRKLDELLLAYINDPVVTKIYRSAPKWYQ